LDDSVDSIPRIKQRYGENVSHAVVQLPQLVRGTKARV
jgi:hypothetical protein